MTRRRIIQLVTLVAALVTAAGLVHLSTADRQSSVRVAVEGRPELSIPLPPFLLRDQDGRDFGLPQLRGRVWIVGFFFTRCPAICPRLMETTRHLASATADLEKLSFASISVDPDNDTPAVVRAYGERYGADFARWSFLTGDQKAIESTVISGFKVAMGRDDGGAILHAERFVLVDAEGRVRGYFDGDEPGQRDLLAAARRLVDAL